MGSLSNSVCYQFRGRHDLRKTTLLLLFFQLNHLLSLLSSVPIPHSFFMVMLTDFLICPLNLQVFSLSLSYSWICLPKSVPPTPICLTTSCTVSEMERVKSLGEIRLVIMTPAWLSCNIQQLYTTVNCHCFPQRNSGNCSLLKVLKFPVLLSPHRTTFSRVKIITSVNLSLQD